MVVEKIVEVEVVREKFIEKPEPVQIENDGKIYDLDLKNVQSGLSGLLSDRSVDTYRNIFMGHYNSDEVENIDGFKSQ